MTSSAGDLGVWGSLVLLGLGICTGARTGAPNPIRNLRVKAQTTSSITMSWEVSNGPQLLNYTYWVQWPGESGKNETRSTTDTSYNVKGLDSASSYDFSVWVENNGTLSSRKTLQASTAPNPVRNLGVRAQTNSSITLSWKVPNGPHLLTYTHWVQWPGQGGKNETRNTSDTSFIVEELEPGTSYKISVWVENNGVPGSRESLLASTVIIVGVLAGILLFVLLGALILFLLKRYKRNKIKPEFSAGVCQTGTFIALDVLLRQLKSTGVVGPFNYVKKMGESRPLMVQTEAQYVFLHQCILRMLQQSSEVQVQKKGIYENLAFERGSPSSILGEAKSQVLSNSGSSAQIPGALRTQWAGVPGSWALGPLSPGGERSGGSWDPGSLKKGRDGG